jgi:hypothetical protein
VGHATFPETSGRQSPQCGQIHGTAHARKQTVDPDSYLIPRVDDHSRLAGLIAGALATYKPINSQERERIPSLQKGCNQGAAH